MNIPLAKPLFDINEKKAIESVLDSGWVIQGKNVAEFERMFCEYTEVPYAKAVSSCTTALHLALVALGVSHKAKVAVPAFTFVATANAVEYVGGTPQFIDISLDTFNIDTDQLEWVMSKDRHIQCIVPVHEFGLCADMRTINAIAKKHNVFVVEDAACALGAKYHDVHAGNFSDVGCFSFHPRKSITTGEGGMLVTSDAYIAEKVESLRNQGTASSSIARHLGNVSLFPDFPVLGYNYRMTDIQGAIGIEQMKKLDYIIESKTKLAQRYFAMLKDIECLKVPRTPWHYTHAYQAYVVLLQKSNGNCPFDKVEELSQKRNAVMASLAKQGIATRQGTSAVHQLGYYKNKYNLLAKDYPNAFRADRLSIALPLYPQLSEPEQDYVIDNIVKILKEQHLC